MIWRVLGFALWGVLAGALIGVAFGFFQTGPAPGPGSDPAARSQFLAERISEMANCGAFFALVAAPIGGTIGWWTARRRATR